MSLRILYEDNHIIAVYKPAGVLVQGDISGSKTLGDEVKEYLKKKYKKPGEVFLGVVHRLDRNVSGIVLLGKTSKGAARLSEQFRNHEIMKVYEAVVSGKVVPKKGRLKHYLYKNIEDKRAEVFDEPGPDRNESLLSYETKESNKDTTRLKIILKTGRFHQIRAQLSAIGHPILGDVKYGGKAKPDGSIDLKEVQIKFKTATTGEEVDLKV